MKAADDFLSTLRGPIGAFLDFMSSHPGGDEIQYRTPLENLFTAIKLPARNFTVIQEDRHSGFEVDGTPDFFVYEDEATLLKRLVGFIECKKPAYPLDKLAESEQVRKYARACENIILTNYSRFILMQKSSVVSDIVLANDAKGVMDFGTMLLEFYQYEYPYINTKKTLARTLAAQSFYYSAALREFMANPDNAGDSFCVKFNGLFGEYGKSINFHYELPDFCDLYSQSLVYGLMLARIDTGKNLDEADLAYLTLIPGDYKLLIEFLSQGYESRNLPSSIKIALTNIGKYINLIDMEAINREFAKAAAGKQSIAVYLYEDFLVQYDTLRGTENRKEGGVYYTPYQAAGFIVRSVNDIIKGRFNLQLGYGDKKVKVLDFACGTGTFLQSIMELLLPGDSDDLARRLAKEKILHDIYGFEINFTPYIIAHTVLTRFLTGKGISFQDNERLGIYLTNTLDIDGHPVSAFLPRLKQEQEKSLAIKGKEEILAVVGNPPYFGGRSRANGGTIDGLVADYKKNLAGETNLQPLDDLYIKFIRFAEWKIEVSGEGVIGIVTSNSFLGGLIHRQMRKRLFETFDEIYILNLHGSSQKKEGDKNIFDIMIGVCLIFFVKYKIPAKNKTLRYFSTREQGLISRQQKLDFLDQASFTDIPWTALNPAETKDFWFVPKDFTGGGTYGKFTKITDIFGKYVSGIQSRKDAFCIKYTRAELDKLKEELANNTIQTIRDKYALTDGRDWSLASAMEDIKTSYNPITVCYRPFDYRWTSLSKLSHRFLGYPFYEVMQHFENKENIGITFVRQFSDAKPYTNILVSQYPIEMRTNYSFQGNAFIAPLYLYGENLDGEHPGEMTKAPNFTRSFQDTYLAALDWAPSPEEILAYIYGALHSVVYRKKYLEFLKTDYPAIPLTRDKAVFDRYAVLGQELINVHLLKDLPEDMSIRVTLGETKGTFIIEKMTLSGNNIHLAVRAANGASAEEQITFSGVPAEVFDFEMGSRKPIDLWIKNRIKDKAALGLEDLQHLKNMIIAIKHTIVVMGKIEQLGEEYLDGL